MFSLGCVLFEALTGTPAFAGQHLMAVLAKILFEQAPRVSDLRPEVPEALDRVVARMLAKSPEDRYVDAAAVAQAFAALGAVAPAQEGAGPAIPPPPLSLGGGERRLVSVVLVGRAASGLSKAPPPPEGSAAPEMHGPAGERAGIDEDLRRRAEARGGRFEMLADGTAVVTITGTTRIAADQAVQAARCALALQGCAPGRTISLTTGQGEVTGRLPVGEVIDRAARMLVHPAAGAPARASISDEWWVGTLGGLRKPGARPVSGAHPLDPPAQEEAPYEPPPSPRSATQSGTVPRVNKTRIAVDEVTARLLDARFEVVKSDDGLFLLGEQEPAEGARTLLGKPTACVGRDRGIEALAALFRECVEGPTAEAALVTAPAGVGKSRVAHELLRSLRERHAPFEVWFGYGDALRAGSAFALVGQALAGAAGVALGEPLEARRTKLEARVARHVPERDARRVAELLGEVVGIPFPDEDSPVLRAARQDAVMMNEQLEEAWKELLLAETAAHPVLLVLENLHWGDLPTVRFVDAALRELKDRPFMVLALGRPEVHDTFPRLWEDRGLTEIRLRELTDKAGERLVRQALGYRRGQRDGEPHPRARRRQRVLPGGADPRRRRGPRGRRCRRPCSRW